MRPARAGVVHDIACTTHLTYRLSCEEYEELVAHAGGRCQICRTLPEETDRGKLCIDHLHGYGNHLVRGLLCDDCNVRMARIDNLREPHTPTTRRYCYGAWFARQLMTGRGHWWNARQRRWEFPGSKSHGAPVACHNIIREAKK